MDKNVTGRTTFFLFVLILAAGFVIWIGALLLVWAILNRAGAETDLWVLVESLSTAVTAAAVFGAGFVAYRELSEAANSRYIDVADRLFNELNSPENIAARRWIYTNLPEDPKEGMETLTQEGRRAVKLVLNSLDHVAFLTQNGWIPDQIIMPWLHPMIAKAWEKLQPYVLYERQRRGEPYYYEYAEKIALRCASWRAAHAPEPDVKWIDGAL